MTCSYIYGLAFGVIPIVLNSVLSRFSRILFSAKFLSVSVSVMSLGDIVLDVLFAGVLKMGMFGMALASSLSTLLAVMVMIHMMRSQNTGVSLCKPENPLKEIWDILRLGIPDALNNACSIVNAVVAKGDMETRRLSAFILRVYACGLPFSTVSIVFQNFFQSMKKMKLVNIICICQNFLFMVGFALLLPAVFGKNAVWLLFPLTHLTTALLILGVSIAHNRRFPRSMEELLMLDAHFGIPVGDRMDLSITSMEQVMGTAKMAESFCLSHGIDQRRSRACALAMEEMAGNIVRHGFGDGKRHSIDVRLSYS